MSDQPFDELAPATPATPPESAMPGVDPNAPVLKSANPRVTTVEETIVLQDRQALLDQFRESLENDERFSEMKYETKRKMQAYLLALVRLSYMSRACRASGISFDSVQYWRKRFGFFREWEQTAQAFFVDMLEQIVDQRAFLGYDEPVYGRIGLMGHRRVFSDSLAALRLRALAPEKYSDKFREQKEDTDDTDRTSVLERLTERLENFTQKQIAEKSEDSDGRSGPGTGSDVSAVRE